MRKNIVAGGKKADQIREMSKHHHELHEIPHAEKIIENALQNISEEQNTESPSLPSNHHTKNSFFKRLKQFFLP